MKVTKISLILNRTIETPVGAILLSAPDKTEVEIIINFRSIDAYKNFVKNPELKLSYFDEFDTVTFKENGLERYVKYGNFKEIVRKTKLLYVAEENKKFNEAVLRNNITVVIDIRGLSFQKKMEIITHPYASDKVYFLDKYTEDEEVSLKDISEMYQYVVDIAQRISNKHYTQLESIYYIYNELRKKIYNAEKKGENANKSRALNHVINGNNIVCAGYTNYFLAISDILGLNVEKITWEPAEGYKYGHASLLAYVNDPKYRACGIWGIDPTWDSKRNDEDEKYINRISHFLMPLAYDEYEKEKNGLAKPFGNSFYIIDETYNRYKRLEKLSAPPVIMDNGKKNIINKINTIYKLLDVEIIDYTCCDVDEEYNKLQIYKKKILSMLEIDKLVNYVTPRSTTDLIETIKSTCSYKCMGEDSKSIYRLVRILKQ